MANGGLGARSAFEHAPAAYISSLAQTQELCTRTWPGLDEYDLDGGLMSSPLLGLLFFPVQVSTTLPVPRPKRVCLLKLKPRFVITCSILRLAIAMGSLTSASIVSLGPVRGFLPFLIPLSPTSRRLCFGSANVVVSKCLFGPMTPMDQWGDHTLVCGCGGDRVTRHNLVRDVVHSAARRGPREAWTPVSSRSFG